MSKGYTVVSVNHWTGAKFINSSGIQNRLPMDLQELKKKQTKKTPITSQ